MSALPKRKNDETRRGAGIHPMRSGTRQTLVAPMAIALLAAAAAVPASAHDVKYVVSNGLFVSCITPDAGACIGGGAIPGADMTAPDEFVEVLTQDPLSGSERLYPSFMCQDLDHDRLCGETVNCDPECAPPEPYACNPGGLYIQDGTVGINAPVFDFSEPLFVFPNGLFTTKSDCGHFPGIPDLEETVSLGGRIVHCESVPGQGCVGTI